MVFLLLALSLTSLSYLYFSNYRPKVLQQLQEVKGAATDDANFTFVYPDGSKELGYNRNGSSMQLTYETTRTTDAIQLFYRNIFEVKGWRRKSTTVSNDIAVSSYKSNNQTFVVTTSPTEDSKKTLVSLEFKGK